MNPTKIQPSTARVVLRPKWINDYVVIESQFGDGTVVEIARMNPEIKREHAMKIAETMAAAMRRM
jgi:hypothetical protein